MTAEGTAAVLAAVAGYGLGGDERALPARPLDDTTWDRVAGRARAKHLEGLLAWAAHTGGFAVTDEQLCVVDDMHLASMRACVAMESHLLGVADRLATAGVAFRVLKGPSFAHLHYPDPALRSFVDIDLLFAPRALHEAVALLESWGYRRRFPEPRPGFDRDFNKGVACTSPEGIELDLHRTFVIGPFGFTVDLDELWAGAALMTIAGRDVAVLGRAHRFIHAAVHAALGEAPPRYLPLRDVAQIAADPAFDLDAVVSTARRWRLEAVVAHAVTTAWALFHLDHTELSTWASGYRATPFERHALAVYLDPTTSYPRKALASLRAIPGFGARLRYAAALALPRRAYVDARYRSNAARLRKGLGRARRQGPARSVGLAPAAAEATP